MIYIVTGEVGSGKTTKIQNWLSNRTDVGGFISPDFNGTRYLKNNQSKEVIRFQVRNQEDDQIEVGRFLFRKSAFRQAEEWAVQHLIEDKVSYILIDELGKLEVKGEGLATLIKKLVSQDLKHIILVIRDYLLDEAIQIFGLQKAKVVDIVDLE